MTVKAKVLVIEDHPEVLDMIMFLLERGGCEVVPAQTGVQGMELAQGGDFDLITLDVDLPGISGFEICNRLKQDRILDRTPVIFVSGRLCEEDQRHGFELGAADYITKPLDPSSFVSRVLAHLRPASAENL